MYYAVVELIAIRKGLIMTKSNECPKCQIYKHADCPWCYGDPNSELDPDDTIRDEDGNLVCPVCDNTGMVDAQQLINAHDALLQDIERHGFILETEWLRSAIRDVRRLGR